MGDRGVLALFVFVSVIAAATAAIYLRTEKPPGFGGAERFVDIPPGSSTKAIGDRLVTAGVVRDPLTYRLSRG